MSTVYQIVIVALLAAFLILFLRKTGIAERLRNFFDKYQATKVIADMLDCDFCFSFWVCVFISILYYAAAKDFSILYPLCATSITRFLL